MHNTLYTKAGLLAVLLLAGFTMGWEAYLRSHGFRLTYNDDAALWAHHREQVYDAGPANPVLVGSSRIKFGLDLATWQAATGRAPTQLAMPGTAPRPLLSDLAQDARFKGTVLVDVTEGLFFAPTGSFPEQQARKNLAYYPKWSIAQRSSFALNRGLESQLVLLDEDDLSLSAWLNQLDIPSRPGVFDMPPFPPRFTEEAFNRQTSMSPEFIADTAMQRQVREIWRYVVTQAPSRPMPDSVLSGIFQSLRADVARIQARGGRVLFVRMPASGWLGGQEKQEYPREKYWDRLLRETGAPGIHFADYPELARYTCPEWSHLSPADARTFTADFIRIMAQKTGWPVVPKTGVTGRYPVSNLTVH